MKKHGIKLFEVGGCVRDDLLGVESKDVDFAVVAPSFGQMQRHIEGMGLKIFLSKPEFLTIRAGVPKGHELRARCDDADFVLCRKDGPSFDGRHPESVEAGSIMDDLARRDFTVNAIARCVETQSLIDPHGGVEDLEAKLLRFVGDGVQRICEDSLRLLRGVRFSITKGLTLDKPHLFNDSNLVKLLNRKTDDGKFVVSTQRMQEELEKMLAFDTLQTLKTFEHLPQLRDVVFGREGLNLTATMKKRKRKG